MRGEEEQRMKQMQGRMRSRGGIRCRDGTAGEERVLKRSCRNKRSLEWGREWRRLRKDGSRWKKKRGSLEKGESVALWRVDNTHHMPINRSSSHLGSPASGEDSHRGNWIRTRKRQGERLGLRRSPSAGKATAPPPINSEGRRTSAWDRGVERADSTRPLAAPGVAKCRSVQHPRNSPDPLTSWKSQSYRPSRCEMTAERVKIDTKHRLAGQRNKHTSHFHRQKRFAAKLFLDGAQSFCVCHAVFIKANYCEGEIDFKIFPCATASLKLQKIWKCRFILAAACK